MADAVIDAVAGIAADSMAYAVADTDRVGDWVGDSVPGAITDASPDSMADSVEGLLADADTNSVADIHAVADGMQCQMDMGWQIEWQIQCQISDTSVHR